MLGLARQKIPPPQKKNPSQVYLWERFNICFAGHQYHNVSLGDKFDVQACSPQHFVDKLHRDFRVQVVLVEIT